MFLDDFHLSHRYTVRRLVNWVRIVVVNDAMLRNRCLANGLRRRKTDLEFGKNVNKLMAF